MSRLFASWLPWCHVNDHHDDDDQNDNDVCDGGCNLSKRWMYPFVQARSPRTTRAVIPSKETVVTVSVKISSCHDCSKVTKQSNHLHVHPESLPQLEAAPCSPPPRLPWSSWPGWEMNQSARKDMSGSLRDNLAGHLAIKPWQDFCRKRLPWGAASVSSQTGRRIPPWRAPAQKVQFYKPTL